jgi:N-acetylglucosaminylphosphatidylinositol deacetylase
MTTVLFNGLKRRRRARNAQKSYTSHRRARHVPMTSSRPPRAWTTAIETLVIVASMSAVALHAFARRRRHALAQLQRASGATVASSDATTAAAVNVLMLIAHPDDESYFFAPTIQALKRCENARVHLCCLSNGDAYGDGEARKAELLRVKEMFELDALVVVDTEDLRDGMTTEWPSETIGAVLDAYSEGVAFDYIVTFDARGVSGHVNHIATYEGTKAWLAKKRANTSADADQKIPEVWMLESTNAIRKFSGVLDFATSLAESCIDSKRRVFFASPNPLEVIKACALHKSQFVWYRKLFLMFSRFTYMNTLRRMD